MKSYNNVTLVGKAVRVPDFKKLGDKDDTSRATFTLAVARPHKDKQGDTLTDFLQIVAWGKLSEICADYIKQGAEVLISGRIQSRSYEIENETKWITEIIADSVNILSYGDKKDDKAK